MNKTNLITGAVLVVLAVVAVSLALTHTVQVSVNTPGQPLGSTPGTDVSSNYFSVGGVQYYEATMAMAATSSEPCQFPNGFAPATSTVQAFSAVISSSSPSNTGISVGANQFDLSTSSSYTGSSTPAFIYGHIVAASATGDTAVWSAQRFASTTVPGFILFTDRGPAVPDGTSPFFLKGTERLTWRIATGTPRTFGLYYVGSCSVVERKG